MGVRAPKNSYDVHGDVAFLTVFRQQGVKEFALFDAAFLEAVKQNGPYHVRNGTIYSVRGWTFRYLIGKASEKGTIHDNITCDYRVNTFKSHAFTRRITLEELNKIRVEDPKSKVFHPRTRQKGAVLLKCYLRYGEAITIRINAEHAHYVPMYAIWNHYRGLCDRRGNALVNLLFKAGVVTTKGRFKLRNLLDYTIEDGLFIHSEVHRITWKHCTTDEGFEGSRCDVWFSDKLQHSAFCDAWAMDKFGGGSYNPSLSGLAQDIMEAAGHDVRKVIVPARYKKYYLNAVEKGNLKVRAKYENTEGMKLMVPQKVYRYRRVKIERTVFVTGCEIRDMRADSMRIG